MTLAHNHRNLFERVSPVLYKGFYNRNLTSIAKFEMSVIKIKRNFFKAYI